MAASGSAGGSQPPGGRHSTPLRPSPSALRRRFAPQITPRRLGEARWASSSPAPAHASSGRNIHYSDPRVACVRFFNRFTLAGRRTFFIASTPRVGGGPRLLASTRTPSCLLPIAPSTPASMQRSICVSASLSRPPFALWRPHPRDLVLRMSPHGLGCARGAILAAASHRCLECAESILRAASRPGIRAAKGSARGEDSGPLLPQEATLLPLGGDCFKVFPPWNF